MSVVSFAGRNKRDPNLTLKAKSGIRIRPVQTECVALALAPQPLPITDFSKWLEWQTINATRGISTTGGKW